MDLYQNTWNREEIYPILVQTLSDNDSLVLAGLYGFTRLLRYLIPKCDVNVWNGLTLRQSARFGQLESVKILIENGASIDPSNIPPLSEAINGGHVEIVKYLVQNRANLLDITSIWIGNNLEMFKCLISLGIPIEDDLLCEFVVFISSPETVKFLPEVRPWSEDVLNASLYTAISEGKVEMAEILFDYGVQIDSEIRNKSLSPEMKALLDDRLVLFEI